MDYEYGLSEDVKVKLKYFIYPEFHTNIWKYVLAVLRIRQ